MPIKYTKHTFGSILGGFILVDLAVLCSSWVSLFQLKIPNQAMSFELQKKINYTEKNIPIGNILGQPTCNWIQSSSHVWLRMYWVLHQSNFKWIQEIGFDNLAVLHQWHSMITYKDSWKWKQTPYYRLCFAPWRNLCKTIFPHIQIVYN